MSLEMILKVIDMIDPCYDEWIPRSMMRIKQLARVST